MDGSLRDSSGHSRVDCSSILDIIRDVSVREIVVDGIEARRAYLGLL